MNWAKDDLTAAAVMEEFCLLCVRSQTDNKFLVTARYVCLIKGKRALLLACFTKKQKQQQDYSSSCLNGSL